MKNKVIGWGFIGLGISPLFLTVYLEYGINGLMVFPLAGLVWGSILLGIIFLEK